MQRQVLITGGSSGIGRALVERFAKGGARVFFTYRSGEERARELVASLASREVVALPFSQGDLDSHAALLEQVPSDLDVLINNAGLGTKTVETMCDHTEDQDMTMMRVNCLGVLWLTQAILPRMLEQGRGKIVFFSSVGGGIAAFNGFRYSDEMSKAAIAHLGRQLALEMAREPVDVFTVCPGATDTPMFQSSTLLHLSEAERTKLTEALPGGRLISPAEIAELCYFLCSDAGRVLRGAKVDASMGLGSAPATLDNA